MPGVKENFVQDNQTFQKIVKTRRNESEQQRFGKSKPKRDSKPWERTDKRKAFE